MGDKTGISWTDGGDEDRIHNLQRREHWIPVDTPRACGCGTCFLRFDDSGRPRRYVSGNNRAGVSHGN